MDDEVLSIVFAVLANIADTKVTMANVIPAMLAAQILPPQEDDPEVIDLTSESDEGEEQDVKADPHADQEHDYDAVLSKDFKNGVWKVIQWSDSWVTGERPPRSKYKKILKSAKIYGVWQYLVRWEPTWQNVIILRPEQLIEFM